MTTSNSRESDPVRRAILAAIDRLLAGTPTRSTGRLSVAQLALEADVKRWHLTHQHTDLKDLFQAKVQELDAARPVHAQAADALHALQQEHAELRRHCAGLEERLRIYANALNLLMLENAALPSQEPGLASVVPLQRRNRVPRPQA